jgi:hypothetical protein
MVSWTPSPMFAFGIAVQAGARRHLIQTHRHLIQTQKSEASKETLGTTVFDAWPRLFHGRQT